MDLINENSIQEIFVGRRKFLENLQDLLDRIAKSGKGNSVRLILNTPGIGKTKTIEYFGDALMDQTPFQYLSSDGTPLCKYALFVSITISKSNTLKNIYEAIIKKCYSQFKIFYSKYPKLLPNVWKGQIPSGKSAQDLTILEFIKILEIRNDPYNNPSLFLMSISDQIPIILHLDEFQETIHKEDKTLYNDIGSFLAEILKYTIFSIITGTKFTIIRTIGSDRISPLNGKTKKLVLPYLDEELQKEFVSKIITNINPNNKNEQKLLEYFTNWIIFNSGGHPRTMEIMTEMFISAYSAYNINFDTTDIDTSNLDELLNSFFIKLNDNSMKELHRMFWKSKYKDFIAEKTQNIPEHLQQSIIQQINDLIKLERKLPDLVDVIKKAPNCENYSDEIIEEFLSVLVQVGYLLINGDDNFYIPSRYALQAFLIDWQKYIPKYYATFIQFSQNPLIQEIMLHSPQSFGWSSEVYIKYGILSSFGIHKQNKKSFPMNYADGYGKYLNDPLQEISVPTSFSRRESTILPETLIEIPENTYVVFANAEAIDALIRMEIKDGNIVLALQITTNKDNSKLKKKFIKLNDYCNKLGKELGKNSDEKLEQNDQKNTDNLRIIPWFISMEEFDYSNVIESNKEYNGLISIGNLWKNEI